jgi:hypothetical protein
MSVGFSGLPRSFEAYGDTCTGHAFAGSAFLERLLGQAVDSRLSPGATGA